MIDSTYSTPGPPLTWWQNLLGTVWMVSILAGFTLVMWPHALCVAALRALKKDRGL